MHVFELSEDELIAFERVAISAEAIRHNYEMM